MALVMSKNGIIDFLNKQYEDDQLLLVSIWSSDDVEQHITSAGLTDAQADKVTELSMDAWADIATTFAIDWQDVAYPQLNDLLYELIPAEIKEKAENV